MRARNKLTGKYENITIGRAICGKRFSSITITSKDLDEFRESNIQYERAKQWLEHVLFTRLG